MLQQSLLFQITQITWSIPHGSQTTAFNLWNVGYNDPFFIHSSILPSKFLCLKQVQLEGGGAGGVKLDFSEPQNCNKSTVLGWNWLKWFLQFRIVAPNPTYPTCRLLNEAHLRASLSLNFRWLDARVAALAVQVFWTCQFAGHFVLRKRKSPHFATCTMMTEYLYTA